MSKMFHDELHDKVFRENLLKNPRKYAQELGYELSPDTEIKIIKSDKHTIYLVGAHMGDFDLDSISAAGFAASTASTLTTAGSASTICSTASTASSIGSISSAAPTGIMVQKKM